MNKVKITIYWLLFIGMLVMNYLSSLNVGNVADRNQTMIQPAGWAFSIWSVIYLLLFIWLIRMTMLLFKNKHSTIDLGYWPAVNFILNSLWIYIFSEESKLLSNVVIIGLLITLIVMYRKSQNYTYDKAVFGIYFAWVTVATIVNIFTWVKSMEVKSILGLNESTWTLIMLVIALVLAVYISFKYHDLIYPLVFAFAYTAIWAENSFEWNQLGIVLCVSIIIQIVTALSQLLIKDRAQSQRKI